MSSNPDYLQTVANAFKTVNAWRSATIAVSVVAAILCYGFVQNARNTPVVLVTHDMATTQGRLTVTTNGEIRGTSNEYLANIALADLGLVLNFTPDNVITQHKRFLNRVTESLYMASGNELLAQAEQLKKDGIVQSFHPDEVKVSQDGTKVYVSGTQIRYRGLGELQRVNLEYIVSYKRYKNFLHVSDLSQRQDLEAEKAQKTPASQNVQK